MKEAFNYMFKDKSFASKAGLYLCLFLLTQSCFAFAQFKGVSLICSIAIFATGLLLSFVLSGYLFSMLKSNIENKEEPCLPSLNFFNDLATGFKWFISVLLFILSIVIVVGGFLTAALVFYKSGLVFTSLFMFMPVYLIIIGGLMILFPALVGIFAQTGEIISLFRIKKAFDILCSNAKNYFVGYVIYILAAAVVYILNGLFFDFAASFAKLMHNTIYLKFGYVCLNSIISTYFIFVFAYLFAKMVSVKEIDE